MAIFVIIPIGGNLRLKSRLSELFPSKMYQMPMGEFLVEAAGTSKELSELIGINSSQVEQAVVLSVGGYWGHAPNDLWEWIRQHWSS